MPHSPAVPTTYLEVGAAQPVDQDLVQVMLPTDVADELRLLLLWISLQTGHQVPVDVVLRHLVLEGLVHAESVLADLQHDPKIS